MQQDYKKHNLSYKFFRPLIKLFMKLWLNFDGMLAPEISGNYLVLANHVTEMDPLLVACSFRHPITFMASEHTMRMGFISRLISGFFTPIQRIKGSTDAKAAFSLISTLKNGVSVCLFPEGTRSFDGCTAKLHSTTGRLVKLAGVTVVTYRISGGYLTSPRWGKGIRRGKMSAAVVHIYHPHEISEMSAEELTARINADLAENAFQRQRIKPCKYKGRNRAEGLERLLYLCPGCHRTGTLKTSGNEISCSCGLRLKYNKFGFFEGENVPFASADEWNKWQEETIKATLPQEGTFFSDEQQKLYRLSADHSAELLCEGRLELSTQALSIGKYTFPIGKINMSLMKKQDILFGSEGVNYQLSSDKPTNALKYMVVFEQLKNKTKTQR